MIWAFKDAFDNGTYTGNILVNIIYLRMLLPCNIP